MIYIFFFFNDTATTEIYTLSLHDALPICSPGTGSRGKPAESSGGPARPSPLTANGHALFSRLVRSEEHTSELQSPCNLVCRLLLEKKKKKGTVTRGENICHLNMSSRVFAY